MTTPKSLTITLQPDGFWHAWMRREDDAAGFGQHLCCDDTPQPFTIGPCRSLSEMCKQVAWWIESSTEPTVGGE